MHQPYRHKFTTRKNLSPLRDLKVQLYLEGQSYLAPCQSCCHLEISSLFEYQMSHIYDMPL